MTRELFSFGYRPPADGDDEATGWIVRPAGTTTWANGSQQARRLRADADGYFTRETAPDDGERETFVGMIPEERDA